MACVRVIGNGRYLRESRMRCASAILDDAAAQANFSVINHNRLAGSDCPLRFVEGDAGIAADKAVMRQVASVWR